MHSMECTAMGEKQSTEWEGRGPYSPNYSANSIITRTIKQQLLTQCNIFQMIVCSLLSHLLPSEFQTNTIKKLAAQYILQCIYYKSCLKLKPILSYGGTINYSISLMELFITIIIYYLSQKLIRYSLLLITLPHAIYCLFVLSKL